MQEEHRWKAEVLSALYRYSNSTFLRIYGLDSENYGLKFKNLLETTASASVRDRIQGNPNLSDPTSACFNYATLPTYDHSRERIAEQMKN